ncbi:MAG: DUF2721 domain-containing protein [Nibricoccus sp.]
MSAALPMQDSFLPIIQLSITPVILISGLGALCISLTNRMGRIVDRTRNLAGLMAKPDTTDKKYIEEQLWIMFRRAKIMRFSMTMITSSMFISGLLIVMLFVSALFKVDLPWLILGLFAMSVGCMLAGLAAFLRDLYLSLHAVQVEVEHAIGKEKVKD